MKRFLLLLFLLLLLFGGCAPAAKDITPDTLMIGQGVGDKADGTFVYVAWAIPQPEPKEEAHHEQPE